MMKDYLDAESGNYKRPTTAAGKRLQDVQRSFMMVTTTSWSPTRYYLLLRRASSLHESTHHGSDHG